MNNEKLKKNGITTEHSEHAEIKEKIKWIQGQARNDRIRTKNEKLKMNSKRKYWIIGSSPIMTGIK